ncbi:MAG: helix-turn-helix domain-containing protein, partial [Chthoniobacterales bacterium]
ASCIWAGEAHPKPPWLNWRTKGTPDYLLIYTMRGSGIVHSHGPGITVHTGDVILFEPHALQSCTANPEASGWHILWVHFQARPHWMPWLNFSNREKGLHTAHMRGAFLQKQIKESLMRCKQNCHQRFYDMAMNALECCLLWIFSTQTNHAILDSRIQAAIDYLTRQIQDSFSVPDLARECGLSVSRFSHLFREQVGVTPQHYVEEMRLQQASQYLLSSTSSISEIAAQVGYANAFYFTSRFKKKFGQTPTEYRQRVFKRK